MENKEEKAMIDKVRDYFVKECSLLDKYTELNINYLADKSKAYSLNENAGYDPIIPGTEDIIGNCEMQFLFTFDSKLIWNEDIQNNIDNSRFFEDFREWLERNDKNEIYPDIKGIYKIGATTNGYIFATNANEAIYRIQCYLKYYKEV